MTDPQRTLIAVLLDRPDSESIKSDAEGGFNAFITEKDRAGARGNRR
ncbi:MAG: hypothetical protein ACRDUX_28530 [Mycobacterium sp.]